MHLYENSMSPQHSFNQHVFVYPCLACHVAHHRNGPSDGMLLVMPMVVDANVNAIDLGTFYAGQPTKN